MSSSDLLHIRVGKAMKMEMQKLIDSGMFSTEAEIAREGIRNILLKYPKEMEPQNLGDSRQDKEKNARKR
jgi:Arc/MetJ-type ribon-helix-helix transcriptional regulator